MNNIKIFTKQSIGWFLIFFIVLSCFISVYIFLFDIKKDIEMYSNKNIDKVLNELSDTKILLDEIINSLSILQKMKPYLLERQNIVEQNIVEQNNKSMPLTGNEQARLLVTVLKMHKAFIDGIPIHSFLYDIKPLLFKIGNHDIENAIYDLEKVNTQKGMSFHNLKLKFEILESEILNNGLSLFEKLFIRWIKIRNNNIKLSNNLAFLYKLIQSQNWVGAHDFAKKELSNIKQIDLWNKELEDVLIIDRNINTLYNILCEYITLFASGAS